MRRAVPGALGQLVQDKLSPCSLQTATHLRTVNSSLLPRWFFSFLPLSFSITHCRSFSSLLPFPTCSIAHQERKKGTASFRSLQMQSAIILRGILPRISCCLFESTFRATVASVGGCEGVCVMAVANTVETCVNITQDLLLPNTFSKHPLFSSSSCTASTVPSLICEHGWMAS